MKHLMPPLPYASDALKPLMSEETLLLHHDKHLQTYVDNLNRLVSGTEFSDMPLDELVRKAPDSPLLNNAAQAWNHIFFFQCLSPHPKAMSSHMEKKIRENFGSVEQFRDSLLDAGIKFFGSGWIWLVMDENGKMRIVPLSNAGNPMREGYHPLLVVDVWEHAYYVDHRNRRADYLNAVWQLWDWEYVEKQIRQPPVNLFI